MARSAVFGLLCLAALASPAVAAPTLAGGSVSGASGATVDLPIVFTSNGASVSSLQFNLTLPVSVSTVSIAAGSVLTAAAKNIGSTLNGTTWTFIVYGLNQDAIGSGTLLSARVKIAASATAGTLSIPISGVVYSDPSGTAVAAGPNTSGSITVTGGSSNQPPTAVFAALPLTGTAPLMVSFSAGASSDPDGTIVSYSWVYGDGSTGTGVTSSHVCSGAGTYSAVLTVTDNGGLTATQSKTVTVTAPQTPTAPTLAGASVSGAAGSAVDFPITFNAGSASIAGLQFSLTAPVALSTVSVTPGSILTNAGKSIGASFSGTTWTFIVYGINQNTIASGTLMTVRMRVAANAASGALTVPFSGVSYTDPSGTPVAAGTNTAGKVTVTSTDQTPPAVSITAPAGGSTVKGVVTISASATDATGVARAEFFIDNVLKDTRTQAPWTTSWDSTLVAAGLHSIAVKAYDAAGNVGQAGIVVTVALDTLDPPDLTGIDGKTFAVTDDIRISYPATDVQFNWDIQPRASGTQSPSLGLASRKFAAATVATSPSFSLASRSLMPGDYTFSVQAVKASGAKSEWRSANLTLVSGEMNGITVHPNPWRAGRHTGGIAFSNVPGGSAMSIYSVSGHLVKDLGPVSGTVTWQLDTEKGDRAASGVYLYVIKKGSETKRGKVAIVR